jgi:hypothetical protein
LSASSPIVGAYADRAAFVPDFSTARYCPLRRFEPSTDALERALRFSQRTSTSAALALNATKAKEESAAAATSFFSNVMACLLSNDPTQEGICNR